MTAQIFPSRVRSSAACVSLLLAGAFVSACEKDPQSDCHVLSNEAAQDPANGFEVTHQSPEHCPVDVPSSGGRTVYYSAKVRVIEGRQTGALALSFYDANNSFIIGGDFAWNPDLSGSKLLSEPAGNYTAGRVPPRFGVSQRDRSLALREFALGVEGLERFVRREPLRRVHECVFGVLALESEPVDPRL